MQPDDSQSQRRDQGGDQHGDGLDPTHATALGVVGVVLAVEAGAAEECR